MRKAIILTVLFLLIIGVFPAMMQENTGAEDNLSPITIPNTQSIPLTSTINDRDYLLKIALPDSYDSSDQAYPVLYSLDPAVSFLSVTEFVRWLGHWGELPELIVVGIGYPTDDVDEVFPLREYDYYQAQDEFIDVISTEIFPLIDSTYRTDSTDRALVGFSYGGEFVFHVLVNRPEIFNRYIAIDAASGEIRRLFPDDDTEFRERLAGLDVRLFFGRAGNETISPLLQGEQVDGLEAIGLPFGQSTHAAALHFILPEAIQAIYAE